MLLSGALLIKLVSIDFGSRPWKRMWKTLSMSAPSIRARARSAMTEEIKAAARRRLAEDGPNLSLRGVARDMGMVASAIYRYFPSRDELLTALIMEAYQAVGAAAEAAEARVARENLLGRWLAVGHAVRDWALANPAEYSLLYGSPVPGYAAPADTIVPATRVILLLVAIAAEVSSPPPSSAPLPDAVRADLRKLIDQQGGGISEELLDRVFVAWTHLFGLVSFEAFGRLEGTIEARAAYFDHHMALMANLTGLLPARVIRRPRARPG
jgi:AcrR family transcriptional regulator